MALQSFIAEQVQCLQQRHRTEASFSAFGLGQGGLGQGCLGQGGNEAQEVLPKRRLSTEVIRKSLSVVNVSRVELLQALKTLPCYPKWYWQDREQQDTVIAWGQPSTAYWSKEPEHYFSSPIDPASNIGPASNPAAKHWCFYPFDPQKPGLQMSPEVEIRLSAQHISLTVYCGADIESVITSLQALLGAQAGLAPLPSLKPINQGHCPTWPQWQKAVGQAHHAMQKGLFDKVVLARKTHWQTAKPICPYSLLAASDKKNAQCYQWLFVMSADQAFISSSPERLLRLDHQTVLTEALAGTSPLDLNVKQQTKGQSWSQWLLNDGKNDGENQWVVKDIQHQLAQCCQSIEVDACELLTLSSLQHLRRSIRAKLCQGVSGQTLVSRLSPTAAVAGYPRQAALEFIRQTEPFERQWYAGCFGYHQRGHSEFSVAIRCAEIKGNQIDFYTGAGIVDGSDPWQEWQELDRKLAMLTSLFGTEDEVAHG